MKNAKKTKSLIPAERVYPLAITLDVTNLERDLIQIAANRFNGGDVNELVRECVGASVDNAMEVIMGESAPKGGKV